MNVNPPYFRIWYNLVDSSYDRPTSLSDSVPSRPVDCGSDRTSWSQCSSLPAVRERELNTAIIIAPALYIATTTLLGRSYTLAYYRALGIPISEINLSAVDYALVSPNVTVASVWISAAYIIWQWTAKRFTAKELPNSEVFYLGLIFTLVGMTANPLVDFIPITPTSILYGILDSCSIVLSLLGGSIMSQSVVRSTLVTPEGRMRFPLTPVIRRVVVTVALLIVLALFTYILWGKATDWGEEDALHTMMNAPTAKVVLEDSQRCPAGCGVKVILTNDRYIYLMFPTHLEAIAADQVKRIEYRQLDDSQE